MNEALKEAIENAVGNMSRKKMAALLMEVLPDAVVCRSMAVMEDYVADLDPKNPRNDYTPEFVKQMNGVMTGEIPSEDGDLASMVADGQLLKQLNIALGKAPVQNYKRGPVKQK